MLKKLYEPLLAFKEFHHKMKEKCDELCRPDPYRPLLFDVETYESASFPFTFTFAFSIQFLAEDAVSKVPEDLHLEAEKMFKELGIKEKNWSRRSTNGITTWSFKIPLEALRGDPLEQECSDLMRDL